MPENGRPSKLTPEIQERIVQALVLGNHRQDAAAYAGIHPRTLRRWLLQGAQEQAGEHADFGRAVAEAEARAKVTAMGCIVKAARDGEWKAAAWWLQKMFPHQFSEQSQLFAVAKAFEQIEAAAEAAGTPLPQSVWETAWTSLAKDLSHKLPALPGGPHGLEPGQVEEELEDVELSEDEKRVLLKVVRATKAG